MQWIWLKDASKKINTYAAFRQNFSYNGEPVSLELSAADEYAVFVNGNFVDCGQYDDYPDLKFFDTLDLSAFCKTGDNIPAPVVLCFWSCFLRFHTRFAEKIFKNSLVSV